MWRVEDSLELYGVPYWGDGYFDISKDGNLTITTSKHSPQGIELIRIVEELRAKGLKPPFLLRFPQLLRERMRELHTAFETAIREFEYGGVYRSVFPVKVNQRREVIEELLHADSPHSFGIEVGSKPELLLAIPYQARYHTSLLCNGYKDDAYLTLALNTIRCNHNTIIVIDEAGETQRIIALAKKLNITPRIGIRTKLYSRGSGKWSSSGGDAAKFGLNTTEILDALKTLEDNDMLSSLCMLHFHIGSQITAIRRIQKAIKEAARIYAKLHAMGVGLQYFNIGGGLGVDYDGSRTSSASSANYTLQEYANNVVYTLKTICDEEGAPHPTIISESGRAVAAYHTLLIINVLGKKNMRHYGEVYVGEKDAQVVQELYACYRDINVKNYEEYYHDAIELKEELINLFNLGHLGLDEKSKGEMLFWKIAQRVARFAAMEENATEEIQQLEKSLSNKYMGNFSIFQSLPDSWAINQLFPILPIHRLDERPTRKGTIADITCDSDGEIDRFVDVEHVKELLELHQLNQRPYYLAIPLVGAYQDTLGDYHNLFGAVTEVHVIQHEDGDWSIQHITPADTIKDVLRGMRYDPSQMLRMLSESLDGDEAECFVELYREELEHHTYLDL